MLALVVVACALAPVSADAAEGPPPPAHPHPTPAMTRVIDGTRTEITTQPGAPLVVEAGASTTPTEVARDFAASTLASAVPGVDNRPESLIVVGATAASGRVVRLQQTVNGIPILGGETVVSLDAENRVVSATSEGVSARPTSTAAQVDGDRARAVALAHAVSMWGLPQRTLRAPSPELWILDPRLIDAPGPDRPIPVWQTEVTSLTDSSLRRLVLVDATTGKVALSVDQNHAVLNREVCDSGNVPGADEGCTVPVRSEGDPAAADADVDSAYAFAGDTDRFYREVLGRDGIDGAGNSAFGGGLSSTVRYCPADDLGQGCPYENAFWNGAQMVYGQGYAGAQDVVGHELTHGVTQFTSRLFYYHQSGAINESLSDIMGEFVDQWSHTTTAGAGVVDTDTPAVRWLIGEDLPGGAIRSMSNPRRDGPGLDGSAAAPDSVLSGRFVTSEDDSGGVHTNSGVGNKFAFLLTDGGSLNGHAVSGIGLNRAAQIIYSASLLLTSAADYRAFAGALSTACHSLVGSRLTTTDDVIRDTDCLEVDDAIAAVQMGAVRTRAAVPACLSNASPTTLFGDSMEGSARHWASVGTREWFYSQDQNPYLIDMRYATSGTDNLWGNDGNRAGAPGMAMRRGVKLPALSAAAPVSYTVRFNHAYGFWPVAGGPTADGGVVEFSVDGGAHWRGVTQARWARAGGYHGYSGVMAAGTDNPLAGSRAFVGHSAGYLTSRFDISDLAGRSVKLRFRVAQVSKDPGDPGDYGWFIDDVSITSCPALPGPRITAVGPGNRSVAVRWAAVAGASSYQVTSIPDGRTCTTSRTRCTVRELRNGVRYRFRVRALSPGRETGVSLSRRLAVPTARIVPA